MHGSCTEHLHIAQVNTEDVDRLVHRTNQAREAGERQPVIARLGLLRHSLCNTNESGEDKTWWMPEFQKGNNSNTTLISEVHWACRVGGTSKTTIRTIWHHVFRGDQLCWWVFL